MAEYKLTHKAVEDLNGIWEYTANEWSEKQADKYYYMLLDSCQDIANHPELGRKYAAITPELYGLKSGQHIIFYRILNDKPIEIVRILHVRMDLKNSTTE